MKITKQLLLTLALTASLWTSAQVGIGTKTPAAGAILELKASNRALLLTRVALTGTNDLTTIPTPVAGMIIYNTADVGGVNAVKANNLYRFNGTKWDYIVDEEYFQNIFGSLNSSILGYDPVPASQKATVATAPGGASVTLVGCKTNPANGHVYCAYQLSAGTNFYNTFQLAKEIGGYIVTMTSNAEREWVNTNMLANGTGYNLNNNIWIGYNKVAFPGNPSEFLWITGEDWVIDWTTSPTSTPESWFSPTEPNNSGGNEGSCHIIAGNADKKWNDLPGSSTNLFNQVIIEFNEQ